MNHIDCLHINTAIFFSDRVSSHNRIRLQSGIEDISSALPQQLLTPHTWTYTFSAKEKDTETGYSYFGSRYYNSDLSIWLSVDPMAGKYPSLSPYVYCADNPVRCVDPNGEEIDDNFDKWKYNKTTKKLDWISNEGGRCHQIVVETKNTSSGEKVNRTVEFDGAIGLMFRFSIVSDVFEGILSGGLEIAGGVTTVYAGATIGVGGSVVTGGAAAPIGAVILSAGAYQTVNGLMTIANAIAGRGVDMYEQQDMVRDICKSTGNILFGVLSKIKGKPLSETIKNTVSLAMKSLVSFSISTAWSSAVRYRTQHPIYKGDPPGSVVY